MNRHLMQEYLAYSTGLVVLGMLIDLGGLIVCLAFRRLSRILPLAAVGFAGIIVSSGCGQLASIYLGTYQELIFVVSLLAGLVRLISSFLLVVGLGFAFADIRRQLALSMEPRRVPG